MKPTDIIIIGAGAAGLMAAYTLVKAGKKVTILEARNRIGGRIHTINNKSFSKPVELGAEFIHGDLPVTLGLLKAGGIRFSRAGSRCGSTTTGHWNKAMSLLKDGIACLKNLMHLSMT